MQECLDPIKGLLDKEKLQESLERLKLATPSWQTPIPQGSGHQGQKLSWPAREKLAKAEQVKEMERKLSVKTIDSLSKEPTQLSAERINGLMKKLEVKSEGSPDISIAYDSRATIYQPLETRLERALGTNKDYVASK